MVQCDYPGCDEWCFQEAIKERDTDGGYTRITEYAPVPEGWGAADCRNLCPKHMSERLRIVEDFYKKGTVNHA